VVVIFRRFVVWLRTILLSLYLKRQVDWKKEVHEIIDIVDDAVDKVPATPTYDLIGPVEEPKKRRRLLNWLRRR
jgi:hypothetical protein